MFASSGDNPISPPRPDWTIANSLIPEVPFEERTPGEPAVLIPAQGTFRFRFLTIFTFGGVDRRGYQYSPDGGRTWHFFPSVPFTLQGTFGAEPILIRYSIHASRGGGIGTIAATLSD